MLKNNLEKIDTSLWEQFISALSDEFLKQTGVGIYAHITPLDLNFAYQEFEDTEIPIHNFIHNYVNNKIRYANS